MLSKTIGTYNVLSFYMKMPENILGEDTLLNTFQADTCMDHACLPLASLIK